MQARAAVLTMISSYIFLLLLLFLLLQGWINIYSLSVYLVVLLMMQIFQGFASNAPFVCVKAFVLFSLKKLRSPVVPTFRFSIYPYNNSLAPVIEPQYWREGASAVGGFHRSGSLLRLLGDIE